MLAIAIKLKVNTPKVIVFLNSAIFLRMRHHDLFNLHSHTYCFLEKKTVGQIFCYDWEEISEKMSEKFEKNNKQPFYYII